ncbi:MAG: AraC family transcriptional regulator, partial [Oscillospiraceae bacterium]|nr:AraC family transcriptional regulator [Oscillospiraceae bacterium]
ECSDKSKYKIFSVRDYLDKHFTDAINLDDLAERFYISKFYLTREFKKEFGITIIHYILNKRMEYAKELLTFTDKTVEEISEICGFNDQSYFSRQFKKSENITCMSYRKNNKNINIQAP